MRKKIAAGNWKMNMTLEEGKKLAGEICDMISKRPLKTMKANPGVIFFTPFIHLVEISKIIRGLEGVYVGAQNCYSKPSGAYTGEVSAPMIRSAGATHVLIGHSERRNLFDEHNKMLAAKASIAIENGLKVVFCCGESLGERENKKHFDVVEQQLKEGLFWMDEESFSNIIIAYEPVWAIGTGITATPVQAGEMHTLIRKLISEKFGEKIAENCTILYGGSCNSKNAQELFQQKNVDGGLIGGASLKAGDFFKIIQSF